MTHSSRKAWCLLCKLLGDPSKSVTQVDVTANQIATQLSLNDKPNVIAKVPRKILRRCQEAEKASKSISEPYSMKDLENALKTIKPGKAVEIDDLRNEILLNLGGGA